MTLIYLILFGISFTAILQLLNYFVICVLLSQLVSCPTHIHGNILDLILTNNEELISTICVSPIDNPLISSDHYAITFELLHASRLFSSSGDFGIPSKATPYYTFIYSKGDYSILRNHQLQTDFSSCLSTYDIERIWNLIELEVVNAMKLFIPIKKHHSIIHHGSLQKLDIASSVFVRFPISTGFITQDKIDTANLDYEFSLVHNFASTNSSKIYDYIKSIIKSNHMPSSVNFNSSTASTDHDKANLFNLYFHSVFHNPSCLPNIDELPDIAGSLQAIVISVFDVYEALISLDIDKSSGINNIGPRVLHSCAEALCVPLHHLFSLSLYYAIVPSCWKVHKVVPIFKAGDPTSVTNYQPISLLSNASKVLERLIFDKLIRHVTKSVSPRQFASLRTVQLFNKCSCFLMK